MDLSIIIVTFNSGDLVLECLQSISHGIGNLRHEIIIVDNASQDGTPERIAQDFPNVRLIANADNRGFATANNQALQVANGRYLLLLNPDMIVAPNVFSDMAAYLGEHPKTGIVGPAIYDAKGELYLSARPPYSVRMILWQYLGMARLFPNHLYGRYRKASETRQEPFEVGWVSGSCLMFRREVYEQIGGLEEAFFLFAEEPDFCDRAHKVGWRTVFIPTIKIMHYGSATVSRYHLVRVRWYHLSALVYFRKRKRPGAVLALKLGFTFELLGKVILRLLQFGLQRKRDTLERVRINWQVLGEIWLF